MKKSLSIVLAMVMVFTMFASVAFAADAPTPLSTQQKYDALKAKGIFDGFTDGSAGLDKPMTRAQFAKVLAILFKLPELTTTNTYTDTNGHWAKGYIEAVSKSNPVLMEGTWTSTFSPEANVTVQELATVLVRALNLPIPTTVTVTGADDWAKGSVAAAVAAGLIPAQSDYKQSALRGALVDATYVAQVKLAKPTVASATATVNANGTATVAGKVENADAVKVTVGTAAAVNATLNADGTFTYTTPALTVGTTNISVVASKGDVASAATALTATVTKFGVSSVTAIDAKNIKVVFNGAIDDATTGVAGGKNPANYVITNPTVAVTSVDLSDDKTTATLKLTSGGPGVNALAKNTAYTISIDNDLKSAKGEKLHATDNYTTSIFFVDDTKPTVTGVSVTEAGAIKVQFSERLNGTAPFIAVNGKQAPNGAPNTSGNITFTPGNDWAEIPRGATGNLTDDVKVGNSYSVYVSQAQDLVANTMEFYNGSVTYAVSAGAPSVASIVAKDEKTLTVTMSEEILNADKSGNDNLTNKTALGLIVKKGSNEIAVLAVTSTDGKVFTVKLNNVAGGIYDSSKNETSVNLEVTIQDYKDLANNLGSKTVQNVALTKDAAGPTLVSSEFDADGFTFTFNEDIGSVDFTKITLTNNDTGISETVTPTINATNNKKVSLAKGAAPNGPYTISFQSGAVVDKAANTANKNAAFTTTLSSTAVGGDGTKPTVSSILSATVPVKDEIRVLFSEQVKGGTIAGSATDLANYKLNGAALPAGSTAAIDSGRINVTIKLPAGSTDATTFKIINIANVQDLNGNVIDTKDYTVNLLDSLAPKLVSAKVDSNSAVILTFSEDVDGKNNGANQKPTAPDFTITVNGTTVTDAQFFYDQNDEKIVKVTSPTVSFATGEVIVKTKASGLITTDTSGNTLATDTAVTATR